MRRPRGLGPAPLPAISDPAAQPTFARAQASPSRWRSNSSIRPGGNPVSSANTGHALPTSQGEVAPARPRTRATSHSGGRAAPPTAVWRPRPRKGAREALRKMEGKQAGYFLPVCDESVSRLQGAALTTKQELAHSSAPAGLAQARRRVDGQHARAMLHGQSHWAMYNQNQKWIHSTLSQIRPLLLAARQPARPSPEAWGSR